MTKTERICLHLELIRAKYAMNPSRYDDELLAAIEEGEKMLSTDPALSSEEQTK
jgi:hypothetical protein